MTADLDDRQATDDVLAWQVLRPLLDGSYLPWSPWALRPTAMVAVCNDVVIRRRRQIVECGSGVSTVVLARLLRQQGAGGAVTSLEHDAAWAELVVDLLAREDLAGFATVLVAPLEGDPAWYATSAVDRLPHDVDLLLVDGPPAFRPGDELRRAPALPRLQSRLVADATVVLDDATRPGEQQVLAGWQATTAWRFETDERSGTATGRRVG